MATLLGSLLVKLGLDMSEFRSGLSASEKELRRAQRSIERTGKELAGFGAKMGLAVSVPLIALGKASIDAAIESREAIGQVEAALKSMGAGAGRTSDQLQGLASGIMKKSLYDDDEILRQVTANMLTFGRVAGAEFDRAQQAAVDLAARMGGDLQGAALMVGKALNDPVKGLAALGRAGIQFTEQQKEQIKAMAAAGNVAGAQRIMLAELESQFKGSAEAMRAADPFAALKLSFAEFQEAVGGQLLKVLPNVAAALTTLVGAFAALPDGAQQAVVIFGAIAAAAGPVLIALGALVTAVAPLAAAFSAAGGLGTIGSVLAAIGTALVPVLPLLAALGAVAAAIYFNWDKIAPILEKTWAAIQETLGPPLTELMNTARAAFEEIAGSELVSMISDFAGVVGNVGLVLLKAFGGALPGIIGALATIVTGVFNVIVDAVRLVVALLSGDWDAAWQAAKDLVRHAVEAIGGAIAHFTDAAIGLFKGLYQGIKDWLGDALGKVWDLVVGKIKWVKDAFFQLYDAVVGHSYIPDMVDGIAAQMQRLDAVMVNPAKTAAERTKQIFEKLGEDVRAIMDRLFPEAQALASLRGDLKALDQGIAAGGAGGFSPDQLRAARDRLFAEADPAARAGVGVPLANQLAIFDAQQLPFDPGEIQRALEVIGEAANDNAKSVEVANVRVVKSFKDMADQTLGALRGMADAIKGGGFLDILGAVINLGLQLGSIGAFGKKIQGNINSAGKVPGFATGTKFAPGGLALVGERGPELVNLPRGAEVVANHELGGLGGGNTYVIKGNLLTPEFWARIQAGDVAAARAGGELGMQRSAWRQSRRVG